MELCHILHLTDWSLRCPVLNQFPNLMQLHVVVRTTTNQYLFLNQTWLHVVASVCLHGKPHFVLVNRCYALWSLVLSMCIHVPRIFWVSLCRFLYTSLFSLWRTLPRIVRRLHASRPWEDFIPPKLLLWVINTALLALLRCKFWAVFTRLSSVVRVTTLYDVSNEACNLMAVTVHYLT
jgi:hypothetical protein